MNINLVVFGYWQWFIVGEFGMGRFDFNDEYVGEIHTIGGEEDIVQWINVSNCGFENPLS